MPDTAMRSSITIEVMDDNAQANGFSRNCVLVRVGDADGHPVAGRPIAFAADNGARVVSRDAVTNEFGIARAEVVSSRVGHCAVTAFVDAEGGRRTTSVTFAKRRSGLIISLLEAQMESGRPVRTHGPAPTSCPCRRWFAQMKHDG